MATPEERIRERLQREVATTDLLEERIGSLEAGSAASPDVFSQRFEERTSSTLSRARQMLAERRGTAPPTQETPRSADDEPAFQAWYARHAEQLDLDPDPDNPLHFYDYRGAFRAGAEPKVIPEDGLPHWPSEFKLEGHPNLIVEGRDTRTGDLVEQVPGPETGRFGRLRQRLAAEAAGTQQDTRFDRLRARLAQELPVTGTPDGDPEGAVSEPQPRELGDVLGDVFHEERGRLGLLTEGARAVARFPGQMLEGVGGVVQAGAVAQRAAAERRAERLAGGVLEERTGAFARRAEQARRGTAQLEAVGEVLEETGTESREFFPASRDITEAETLDLTDPNVLVSGGVEAITQLGSQLLLAAGTGGGSAVTQFLMFAGPTLALEGGNAYLGTKQDLLDRGLEEREAEERAAGAAVSTGLGAMALERIPAARFVFRRIPGAQRVFGTRVAQALAGRAGVVTGIVSGAAAEGVEEALQEAWAATVQDIQINNPEAWKDIGPRLAASATFGAIGGGFAGTVQGIAERGRPAAPEPAPAEPSPGEPPAPAPEPAPAEPAAPAARPAEAEAEAVDVERRATSVRRRLADLIDPSSEAERRAQDERLRAQEEELTKRFTDELTGVQNPDAFRQAKPRLEADPDTELVLIDLRNFKAVNDLVSMEAGDQKLKDVAEVLKGLELGERGVFRAGGDEFVVTAATGTGEALGRLITERIGETRIGTTDLFFGSRFGVGATFDEADVAAKAAKKAEEGPRFRTVTAEGVVERGALPAEEFGPTEAAEPKVTERKARLIPTRSPTGGVEIRTQEIPTAPPGETFTTREVPKSGGLVQIVNTVTGATVGEPGMPVVVNDELRALAARRSVEEVAPAPPGPVEELEAVRAQPRAKRTKKPKTGPELLAAVVPAAESAKQLAHHETIKVLPIVGGGETHVIQNNDVEGHPQEAVFSFVETDASGTPRLVGGLVGPTSDEMFVVDTDGTTLIPLHQAVQRAREGSFEAAVMIEAFRRGSEGLPRPWRNVARAPLRGTEELITAAMERPVDVNRALISAVRQIFGLQPELQTADESDLMTAIDMAFSDIGGLSLPGGIDVFVEDGSFAHLRGRPNAAELEIRIPGQEAITITGKPLRDLVRSAVGPTDLELEHAGQLLLAPIGRLGGEKRRQTDPVVDREATAAEATAQREAEAEVRVLMGDQVATPEQIAEIETSAEVVDVGAQLEGAAQEVAPPEPARDLPGARTLRELGGAPRGGRPGGALDVREDVEGARRPEPTEVDAGPDPQDGPGSRAAGDRTGERPGDPGSRSAGRLPGLSLRIAGDLITEVGSGGPITKTRRNLAAIQILKDVEAQGRQATRSEQEQLVLYSGWGGIPQVFNLEHKRFGEFARELQALLTPEEYRAARESTVNAHFTSTDVIQEMHTALERMGLPSDAQVLEPAMGIGHFLGLSPGSYRWFGVELDSLTGRMAKLLYPTHEIHQRGFEETPLPDGHFDAAISNVPFGDFVVDDPAYRHLRFSIHNYFFAKSLDKVRPGGLVAFITSRFTMDAKDATVRNYLAERADFLGAIRLPETAFRKSSGTDVVTDVLFLRKRAEGEAPSSLDRAEWLQLAQVPTAQGEIRVNAYYEQNPDQVVGDHTLTGTMHGTPDVNVVQREGPLRPQIAQALANLPQDVVTRRQGPVAAAIALPPVADAGAQEGAFRVVNDEIMQVREGRLAETRVPSTQLANVKDLIELRDSARALLRLQLAEETTDEQIATEQATLNRLYDAYVKARGPINREQLTTSGTVLRPNYTPFRSDPDAPLVAALEVYDSENDAATKAAIFSRRVIEPRREVTTVERPADALPVALAELGRVDLPWMARLAGVEEAALIEDLRGRIYQDPESRAWQADDEYLSGNVREKLILARSAAASDPAFRQNVDALEKVQPEDLPPSAIGAAIGAPWIPVSVFEEFINELLETEGFSTITIGHSEAQASYTLETGARQFGVKATAEWGTDRVNAGRLFELALNQQSPTVMDKIDDRSVKNVEATRAAREKLRDMKERFAEWLWQRDDAPALAREYNDRFNNMRDRTFDGSHVSPAGISPGITLQKQQLDAAWRIISSGNTMLAHVVGGGKTYTMQVASMEEKRMGLIKKPAHVVPNHMLEQYTREFLQLYPSARLLAAGKQDFTKDRRQALMARIATGDWDAVVMTHSAFGRLDVSRETRKGFIERELDDLEEQIREARGASLGETRIIKVLVKAQKRAQDRLGQLLKAEAKDPGLTFEDLGIDRIFLDEAHLFKNLHFTTKMEGISASASQRASDLHMKIGYLEGLNPGRSTVFATATPIANSLAEVYTMMRYLQAPLLEQRGVAHFDAWAAQFGETVMSAEIKPDGSGYRMKERFSRFKNIPELSQMFRQVWDVKRAADLNLKTPRIRGGTARVVISPASDELTAFVQELAERADNIRNVDPSVDNMLKITTEGRKAALDMRLIDPSLGRDPAGKAESAADEIFDIWTETADERLTQLVFIDFSAPKAEGFHVYGEVRELLLERGIPAGEIAFMHDATTDLRKAQLFRKVREGKVRVLFGSTEKMGVGTNVQKRLKALHHLDAPWRPADVEQRDGRGVRQGNDNEEIELIRYVTEGSFDAYMWQGLERKQFFIEQVMSGDPTLRRIEDIGETSLNAAETKALASGNPLAIEKASVDADVARLQRQARSHLDDQFRVKRNVARLPGQIDAAELGLQNAQTDAERRIPTAGEKFAIRLGKAEYAERTKGGERLIELLADFVTSGETEQQKIGTFAGFDLFITPPGFADRKDRPGLNLVGRLTYHAASGELTPVGLLRRLEALAERIPNQTRSWETELRRLRTELRQSQELLGQPYARQDELERMMARQAEIDAALNITGPQQDEQIAAQDEGVGDDVHGELGLTKDELEERDDAGFLDLRPLFTRRTTRDQMIASDFPEIEARYQASKGIERPGLFAKAQRAFNDFVAAMRRTHPEIDPDESTTMALNTDVLRQFSSARSWSLATAYAEVRKVMDGLTEAEVDLVTRMLVLPDIAKDVEEGLYEGRPELPFGYDEDTLVADLAKFTAAAKASPAVTAALQRRGEINRTLTKKLVQAGLLPKGVLEDDRYYHRQVLKYFQARDFTFTGVGGRDVRLRRKGFQKARVGGGDFNTAYQESEVEWMSQGFELLARMGTLERLQQLNDVKGSLKAEAKVLNEQAAMDAWRDQVGLQEGEQGGPPDPFLVYRTRIAFSNAGLAKLAAAGELQSEGGRFNDVIEQLGDAYDEWKSEQTALDKDLRTPFRFEHGAWFDFLSHILDNELPGAMQAATIFKAIQDRERLTAELAGPAYINPKDPEALLRLAPEGYTTWQPDRGTHLFLGMTVEERVLEAVLSGERQLEREDVREQLVVGGPKETWIIPGNVARALDDVKPFADTDPVDSLWRAGQQSWKQWILLNPLRALRYNLNNMSGDVDIAFAYDPAIVKGGVQAAKDLAAYFRGKASPELTAEILEYTRLGVVGSTLRVAEIPDISEAGAFRFLTSGRLNPGRKIVNRYWSSVRGFTDWRENILRLSAARYFDARIRTGKEPIYAASRRTEIDAITNPRQKAAKLSRELIGDYGAISKGGVWMRRHLIPFYSWIEINAPRYYRLLANTKHEGQAVGRGRRLSAIATKKAGLAVLKMNVLFLLANLWNHLFFPDEEDELQRGRRQLHLILGRREDGTIRSLRMEGALSDALEWFNLQDYPSDVAELLSGRKSILDQGAEFVKAPVERIINSWEPFTKTVFETVLGRSTYPTVFEEGASFEPRTRPIRDRGEHVARTFSLDRLYNRVTGKPIRKSGSGLDDFMGTILLYSTDPGEAAFWQTRDMVSDWLEQSGQMRADITPTRRSTALYYWKKAVQWGDETAAIRWEIEYRELGGTDQGMRQSLRLSAPLGGIAQREEAAFYESLSEREQEIVDSAEDWFFGVFEDVTPPGPGTVRRRAVRRQRTR